MRRNYFGEPLPATAEEIIQVLDERDLQAEFAQAQIYDAQDEEEPFRGWVAEISDADTGENRFSTLGFETRDALDAALDAAGIQLIEDI